MLIKYFAKILSSQTETTDDNKPPMPKNVFEAENWQDYPLEIGDVPSTPERN